MADEEDRRTWRSVEIKLLHLENPSSLVSYHSKINIGAQRGASRKTELTELKQRRGRVKSQVIRLQSFFEANSECSAAEAQQQIEEIDMQDGVPTEDDSEQVTFEERYYSIAAKAQQIIIEKKDWLQATLQQQQQRDSSHNQASTSGLRQESIPYRERRNKPKLPEIKLPEFSREYIKWLFFKNSFETTIHNDRDLTGPQKFQYLIGMLTGEARKVIEGFSNENYENAWQLLKNTYDNEMMIIETHLDALFNFPSITKDNKAESIRQLIWHIQTHKSSLKSLHQPVDHWDTIILHLSKKKLDYIEQRDWQDRAKDHTPQNMPKLDDFIAFLTERCHTLRMLNQNKITQTKQQPSPKDNQEKKTGKKIVLAATSLQCKICNEAHQVFRCNELLKLAPDERKKCIMEKRLCINCLNTGHQAKECRASTCKKCSGRHNTLLHREEHKKTEEEITTAPVVVHCTNAVNLRFIRNSDGKRVICRALLDPGSQLNVITTDLLQRLKLPWTKGDEPVSGIGRVKTDICKVVRISLEAIHNDFKTELECVVLPAITEQIPQRKINSHEIIMPKGIQLADPAYKELGEVDLLVGLGLYWKLVIGAPRNRIDGQPALQNTKLGWIIGGSLDSGSSKATGQACLAITNDQLYQQVEKFWKVDSLPEVRHYTAEEEACERYFIDTTRREQDGRFVVRLPTRPTVQLGNSRDQAQRRLQAVERSFQRNPDLQKAYYEFMDDYEQQGHMSKISEQEFQEYKEVYFLPHQAVLRPDKSTTKIRVVFDASSKTALDTSLNDKLLTGPNLQNSLFKVLIKFRMLPFVINADVAQMFRQILVDKRDRALQLILWRRNSNEEPHIYQLNTVTYRTANAPYHAMRCIRELTIQHQEEYPMASKAIIEDSYMDDILSGGNTRQEVIELQRQLFELLQKGQFFLRKWRSNDRQILQPLLDQRHGEMLTLDKDEAKTLGLLWCSSSDTLQYKLDLPVRKSLTKRTVLSHVSQIFDLLGLLGPVLIKGKIFMQKLWADDLQWDQPLPLQHQAAWHDYYELLSGLSLIRPLRNINPDNIRGESDLFGFGDASQSAFGACLYIVSTNQSGNTSSHLFCAKSKVAPLKTLSLPRLELEAALLLAQLYDSVKTALKGRIRQVHLWSDSTIVLGWIKMQPHVLKTFVANRVAKIQELTASEATWRHVPSEENPADLLSRGVAIQELEISDLWWHGPNWIKRDDRCPEHMQEPSESLPEVKAPAITLVTTQVTPSFPLLLKHESFGKICRIIAYCFRFIDAARRSADKSKPNKQQYMARSIGIEEMNRAEKVILKQTQREGFPLELRSLASNQDLPRENKLKSLSPFIDDDGLIRIGGRLRHARLSEEQKHPIVLPARHRLALLIMREEHIRMLHCPSEQLLHSMRQRYWPIHGRRLAQKIVRTCVKCFRYNPRIPDISMGDLPKERVIMPTRPFMVTGVDYAGPFQLRESRRRGRLHVSKGYVALFICFSTKAVHLEVVTSLTSEAFIAALSRFTARRGLCAQLFSNNGTNFVGAS
ncbi:uncharacterized protein LOC113004841 [Solenopsis invicta]|uniref:uncharacterized protein LOC113004841 n=1 Tax=Solenopsis invicta TaxID=13686 RepID=UPI00193E28B6|nr:uncharacterized protein LOC113004841 [Solenopsis invicta]